MTTVVGKYANISTATLNSAKVKPYVQFKFTFLWRAHTHANLPLNEMITFCDSKGGLTPLHSLESWGKVVV